MAQYTVKSPFVNKAKGAKADGRPLEVGARVPAGVAFESPDEAQIARLIAARCLEDPEGRSSAGGGQGDASAAPADPSANPAPAPGPEALSPISPPDPAKVGRGGGRGGRNGAKPDGGGRSGRGGRAKAAE